MTERSIWRRRVALMAVVGFLVAVPITLLIRGGDGDEALPPGAATTVAQSPQVGPGVKDRGLGVRYRVPEGWEESKKASAVRLSSPDASAELVIAAPAPAAEADALLQQTLDAFKAQYKNVDVAPGGGRDVGGLEANGAVVRASRGGKELSVLVAVAEGKEQAYLVEVFTAPGVSAERLREAQAALNSLKLKG